MVKKRIKVRKKKTPKLPRRLLFVASCDKDFTERWDDNRNTRTGVITRDPLNIPGMRIILCGRPGCGKTSMIKNILMRVQESKKPFINIYVLHQDKYAREYRDIDACIITELPENDFWMGYSEPDDSEDPDGSDTEEDFDPNSSDNSDWTPDRPKTLLIIDDICFKDMKNNKHQTALLDRLCGFISTHCNVSLAVLNQDVFAIDPIIRKCCNVWCIWRPTDRDQLMTISRRCGLPSKELECLFDKHAPGELDSVMIDKTPHTPFPIRVNGFNLVENSNTAHRMR